MSSERIFPTDNPANEPGRDLGSRSSEALLELIRNSVPALISYVDTNLVYRSCNLAYSRWFGLPTEAIVGKTVPSVLGDEAWKAVEPHMQEALSGRTLEFESELPYQRGGTRWVRVAYTPDLDNDGTVRGIVVLVTDITEAKRAEETRARLSAIVESSHDAIISKNLDGVITSWNAGAQRLFGYSAEEAIGQSVKMLIPPDRHNEEPTIIGRIRRGERIDHYETIRRHKDGTLLDISLTVSPIADDRGNIIGASKIARDVTEQKQILTALQEKERRFREMIDALPVAVYTTDAEGRLTHYNSAAIELSGRRPELGTDQWCVTWKLYRADGTPLPLDECPMAVALKTGTVVQRQEVIVERPDGTRVWIQPYPTPLRDADGNIVGGINMLLEITARKRAEDAVKALNAQLGSDLDAMTKMHEVSVRLVQTSDFSSLLYELLDVAIEITDADMGNIQLLNDGILSIVAHRGFDRNFLAYFNSVHNGQAACGTAIRTGTRVIIEDVAKSPVFVGTPELEVMMEANARAVQATPLVSRSGQLLGMLSTHYHVPRRPTTRELRLLDLLARQAADFIERNQAEEALRESEGHLSTFLAQLPVGAGAVDLSGRWVVSNARIRSFMPNSIPSLDSERIDRWQAFDAEGNPLPARDWPGSRALRGEADGLQAEMEFTRDDGSKTWTRVTAAPLRSDTGFMIGATCIVEDIDAIKQAELALRESEDRHRSLISVITDVPWTTDANGSFVKPQESWSAYTGQSWEQMCGLGWIDAIHPEDRERILSTWQWACRTGNLYEARGRLWNESAEQFRHFQLRATPLLNAEGAVSEWVGACTDMDDEIRAKENLKAALDERMREITEAQVALATAHRMAAVGTLASCLAHDIDSVLAPLSLQLENLARRSGLAAETRGDISAMAGLLDHLRRMTDNLALFSRDPAQEGTAGSTELGPWRVRVQDLLASSLAGGKKRNERRIVVKWDVPDDVPAVAIAPHRLTQVMLNVFGSAREAMAANGNVSGSARVGDSCILVEARALGDASAVTLRVLDGSDSMPLFDLFSAAESKPSGSASVLGAPGFGEGADFSLVSSMLERVGGSLSIDREAGKGTAITMLLPAAKTIRDRARIRRTRRSSALHEEPRIGEGRE